MDRLCTTTSTSSHCRRVQRDRTVSRAGPGAGTEACRAGGAQRGAAGAGGAGSGDVRRQPLVALSDVRDAVSIQAALAQIILRGQRIEMAVLSSGVGLSTNTDDFTTGTLEEMFQTNVLGAARWLEALQPVLRAQPGGATIAVISSLSADRSFPGAGAGYSASKAAVSQLCDGLRAPWARQGIRLVTVAPGFIRTPMTDDERDAVFDGA